MKLAFSSILSRISNPNPSGHGFFSQFLRDESGSYLFLMALLVPVIIGVAGLSTEGGYWLYKHRVIQSAADNAAFTAATALALNSASTLDDLRLQAKAITASNYGLVDGAGGVTVTLNKPPVGTCSGSAQYVGATNATEVIVATTDTRLFSKLWFSNSANLCGRAVALTYGGGDCVLATGTSGTVISTTKNGLDIHLSGCGFFSNSNASDSISVQGNNDSIVAESIGTVGGALINGNAKTGVNVTTGNPPLSDPYAADAATWPTSQGTAPTLPTLPTVTTSCAGCAAGTATTTPPTTPPTQPACDNGNGGGARKTITLSPGNWTSATLGAANLGKCNTVNLTAGTYVFAASFNVSNATLNIASGVTIIVTGGGLTTGNVNFGSGNYSIYIAAGGWTSNGTTTFGSGNYNISIVGSDWTTSGATTFGNGNYTIGITKAAGTGGNWNISGTANLGTGTYNITLGALWTLNATTTNFGAGTYLVKADGGWTISQATTLGNGNFNITLGGPWTISGATTLGSGNYTFKITGDLVTTANLTMGSGIYSGSTANWTIGGTTTTIGKGVYYLSGNFNVTGTTVTASSVTLVLTGATSIISDTGNNSTLTLTAPLSGWNAGVAIWEPLSTGSNLLASGNNSIANITGLIYAPGADVKYLGNTGNVPRCTQIVAKSVEFGGNSINFTGACGGVPGLKVFGQVIALVE